MFAERMVGMMAELAYWEINRVPEIASFFPGY